VKEAIKKAEPEKTVPGRKVEISARDQLPNDWYAHRCASSTLDPCYAFLSSCTALGV